MNEYQIDTDNLLSSEDINRILTKKLKSSAFNIVSYKLEPFDERIGLLGDHANLKILVDLNQNGNGNVQEEFYFFVKFFPFVEVSADFARKTGAFTKEVFTNEILFSKIKSSGNQFIKKCVPECYLTDEDRVLVFDDLCKEDFETIDKHKDFDFDMIVCVLKSLVKLHASSIIYEEQTSQELGREYRLIEDYENDFEETFFNDKEGFVNKKGVQASTKGILTEIDYFKYPAKLLSGRDFKEAAKSCCFKLFEMVKSSKKYRNVIAHGDLWSSNILIKYDQQRKPVECKFVDFQLTRYVPPSHDVMSVLHLTTTREFRKQHMNDLIDLYYQELQSTVEEAGYGLKNIISYEDFIQSCEEQKTFALAQAATYFQLILVDSEALKVFFADPVLSNYALHEDRSALILANIDKDEFYRKKLEASIKDLRDYCEKSSHLS